MAVISMGMYGIRCSNTIVLLMHTGFMFSISKEFPFLRLLSWRDSSLWQKKNGYSLNKQMMWSIFSSTQLYRVLSNMQAAASKTHLLYHPEMTD